VLYSYIATLVERHTRYVMLAKAAGKDTRTVVSALINRRLFLRSAKPVAARVEREHQWPAETVLSKGADLSVHSQAYLNKVARQLNERPRETFQFEPQQRDLTPVLPSTG
jgi:IS30 family transposase